MQVSYEVKIHGISYEDLANALYNEKRTDVKYPNVIQAYPASCTTPALSNTIIC